MNSRLKKLIEKILELRVEIPQIRQSILNDIVEQYKVYEDIYKIEEAKLELANKTLQETAELDAQIGRIQSTCNHLSTTYYPDASGNNDSSTVCDLCGKEV